MQFTVNELSETMDIEYALAAALCKLGVAKGSIREVDLRGLLKKVA